MSKKIYVAGKVTGLPHLDVVRKFNLSEKKLQAQGYEVVNPVKLVNDPNADWKTAMRTCVAALCTCDYIFMQLDWRGSQGACLEYSLATKLGIEIIVEKPEFKNHS